MTKEEKHDFVADVVGHLLERINKGNEIFVIFGFAHDNERNSMHVTSATVKVSQGEHAEQMSDHAYKLMSEILDKIAPRWDQ